MNRRQMLDSLNTRQLEKIARLILHSDTEKDETKERLIELLDNDESDKEARRVYGDADLVHLIYSYSRNNGSWAETREEAKKRETDELMKNVYAHRNIADLIEKLAKGEISRSILIRTFVELQHAAKAEDDCSLEDLYEVLRNSF